METFVTSEGREVPLRHVASRYIEMIRAKHTIPDPPTYTFEAAGGVKVTKEHDEESAEQTGPEAVELWKQFVKDRQKAWADQEQEVLEFLIYQVIAEDPPPVEEWGVDFDLFDLPKPDDSDPIKYKAEWVLHEIVADHDDYAKLVTRLYEMGGLIDSARAAEFEGLFRITLQRLAATLKT